MNDYSSQGPDYSAALTRVRNRLSPQEIDDKLNTAPGWARRQLKNQIAEYRRTGVNPKPDVTPGEKAISAAGRASVAGVSGADVYKAINYPILEPVAEELDKAGPVGRVAGSVARVVTPLTIAGSFLGGEGIAVNLLGRGALSLPKYGTMLAASGLGAGIGKEEFGTPGEILGGLAGGWAALAKGNNAEQALVRKAGQSLLDNAEVASKSAQSTVEALQQGPYKSVTLPDGTVASAITTDSLAAQIRSRAARAFKIEQSGTAIPFDLEEFKATTQSLTDFHDWLRSTGRTEVIAPDIYDAARKFTGYRDASASGAEWLVRSTEADRRAKAIADAIQSMPNYHLADQGTSDMSTLFRSNLHPEAEIGLQNLQNLGNQVRQSAATIDQAKADLLNVKGQQSAHLKSLLDQVPAGSKTSARNYISARISGDAEAQSFYEQRLAKALGDKYGDALDSFDTALGFHSARGAAESTLADLSSSHAGLVDQFQSLRRQTDAPIKAFYSKATNELGKKILQPEGSRSLYRSAGLVNQDGQLAVNLEKITPAKDAKEAVQAGAALDVTHAAEIGQGQDKLNELLAQRQAARMTGASKEALRDFRVRIDEARAEVTRLKTPAMPVPAEQLPKDPDRLLVPLSDTQKFQVWEPAARVSSTATGPIRDAQTVSMLNKQTKLKLEMQSLGSDMAKLDLATKALSGKEIATDSEKVLLSQGITDGVRPELLENLRRQSQAEEQRQILQGRFDAKQTEADALDSQVLRSQQTLQATLQDAQFQAEFAKKQHLDAVDTANQYWGAFEDSLRLPPEGIALQQARNFKETNDYFLKSLTGKLGTQRLSQKAFDGLLQDTEAFHARVGKVFAKGFQEQHTQFVDSATAMIPSMGDRAAFRQMAMPFSGAERNLDPDAKRSGISGFARRILGGTGFRTTRAEGIMATALNGQQTAGVTADIIYHGYKLNTANLVDSLLKKTSQWDQLRAVTDPESRLRAYLGGASYGPESKNWQRMFQKIESFMPDETEKADLYDAFHDSFVFAGLNPELYDWKGKIHPAVTSMTREFGNQFKGLQAAAQSDAMVSSLVKVNYRKYFTPGRIADVANGAAKDIKTGDRSFLSDALSLKRNAEAELDRTVPLSEMLIPKNDWEKTLSANLLNKVGSRATYEAWAQELKDPTQIQKLVRGEPIARSEWKSGDLADDWAKGKEMLQGVSGAWVGVQEAAKYMQRVASSVLIADLGYLSIQQPLAIAISPVMGAKAALEGMKTALTDEGFHAWTIDNWDKLQYRVSKGMGVGHESIFGQASSGNIYQMIPGLKGVGNAIQALDNFTFGRMQLINKMKYIDTLENDVGLLKTLGKDVGQAYVEGIPVLRDLHNSADIWQATNEELHNQFIRLANNALGGVPRSQTLIGARRQAVENTLLMVPGFFRARSGLITQAARALTNPHSPEGYLAISLLAREAGMRLAVASGIAVASGTMPEFQKEVESGAAFDPRKSGGMLSGPLGDGGYLGFSWGNAAPKLYSQMLFGFKEGSFNVNPMDRAKAIQSFFEGRENPAIATALDQIRGQDFFGRPLKTPADRIINMVQAVAPTWVGAGLQAGNEEIKRDGHLDPVALAAETGAQFLGMNANPGRPYDKLNNQFHAWQLQHFPGQQPLDWTQSTSDMKRMAREAMPDLANTEQDFIYDQNRRASGAKLQSNAAFDQYQNQNSEYDAKVAEGTARVNAGQIDLAQWKDNYSSVQEDKADASDYLSKRLAALGVDLTKVSAEKAALLGQTAPAVAQALIQYRMVQPKDFLISENRNTDGGPVLDQDINWPAFKQARADVLTRFSPQVQSEVTKYLEPPDPIAQRLTQSRSDLDTYFDKLPKYTAFEPDEGKYIDFVVSSMRAIDRQLISSGVQNVATPQIYQVALQQLQQDGKIATPKQQQLAAIAFRMALDSQYALQQRNPQSLAWLIDHPDMFRFYPWLNAEVPNKLKQLLPPDVNEADINAIASRKLQGVDLSQIQ